jgi:haloalkane dehalogenase
MFEPARPLPEWLRRELPHDRVSGLVRGQRMTAVDHGPRDALAVVLVHGNPTWSFLWRKVIALLPSFRCVAPDLLGLGFSDRIRMEDHSVERHGAAIADLVEGLDLRGVVLVGQDWGGPFGTEAARRVPDRIAGCVFANTVVSVPSHPRASWFHHFARVPGLSDLVFRGLGFPQNLLWVIQGDKRSIRGDVARAYRWPLRSWKDRGTPLALARMVPHRPDHPTCRRSEEGTSGRSPSRDPWPWSGGRATPSWGPHCAATRGTSPRRRSPAPGPVTSSRKRSPKPWPP